MVRRHVGIFLKNLDESKTPSFTSYEEQELIQTGVENDTFDVVRNGQFYQVLVHTNSTLDSFEFDSGTNAISLIVDGPAGTSGICNITIPSGLVPAGSSLEAFVDGTKANSTVAGEAGSYFVSVGYPHSRHTITVDIVNNNPLTSWLIWAIVIVVIAVFAGAIYYSRKRHHRRRRRA